MLLSICPNDLNICVHKETCTWMGITAFFIIANIWKQPRGPSVCEQINSLFLCPDNGIFFSAKKKYTKKPQNRNIRWETREAWINSIDLLTVVGQYKFSGFSNYIMIINQIIVSIWCLKLELFHENMLSPESGNIFPTSVLPPVYPEKKCANSTPNVSLRILTSLTYILMCILKYAHI